MIGQALSFGYRALTTIAGASRGGVGATVGKGVAKEGAASSSQVMGLVQSVIGLADESKNLMKDVAGKPFGQAAGAAEMSTSIVNNDANGLIQQMDALPDGVKKFSRALTDLTNSIIERSQELGKYNGALATSSAGAEIKRMQSDIKEANYVGKSYSGVIDAKADFDSKLAIVLNPIKDSIATVLKDLIDKANTFLDIVNNNIQYVVMISEGIVALNQAMQYKFDEAKATIEGIPEKIAKAQAQKNMEINFVRDIFNNSVQAEKGIKNREIPMPGQLNMGMDFANFG